MATNSDYEYDFDQSYHWGNGFICNVSISVIILLVASNQLERTAYRCAIDSIKVWRQIYKSIEGQNCHSSY